MKFTKTLSLATALTFTTATSLAAQAESPGRTLQTSLKNAGMEIVVDGAVGPGTRGVFAEWFQMNHSGEEVPEITHPYAYGYWARVIDGMDPEGQLQTHMELCDMENLPEEVWQGHYKEVATGQTYEATLFIDQNGNVKVGQLGECHPHPLIPTATPAKLPIAEFKTNGEYLNYNWLNWSNNQKSSVAYSGYFRRLPDEVRKTVVE